MPARNRNSESHMRVAHANPTDGRTDGRTSEIGNLSDRPNSATRAHVQTIDDDVVSLYDVLAAGIGGTRERFPQIRSGEREPIPYHVRAAVWLRDRGICQKCFARNPKPWELDHIVPWSAGGSDSSDNLRVLCQPCNQDRSNYDDGTSFAKQPVTWWCHRCYVDPVAWDYDWPAEVSCPRHRRRYGDDYAQKCAVERIYHWQRENGEIPDWHRRAPIEALSERAFCAHCHLPGLTDVVL